MKHNNEKIADAVFDAIYAVSGISRIDLKGKSRVVPIPENRLVFMLAMRALSTLPAGKIGALINRDRTTVTHRTNQSQPPANYRKIVETALRYLGDRSEIEALENRVLQLEQILLKSRKTA